MFRILMNVAGPPACPRTQESAAGKEPRRHRETAVGSAAGPWPGGAAQAAQEHLHRDSHRLHKKRAPEREENPLIQGPEEELDGWIQVREEELDGGRHDSHDVQPSGIGTRFRKRSLDST